MNWSFSRQTSQGNVYSEEDVFKFSGASSLEAPGLARADSDEIFHLFKETFPPKPGIDLCLQTKTEEADSTHRRTVSEPITVEELSQGVQIAGSCTSPCQLSRLTTADFSPSQLSRLTTADFFFGPEMGSDLLNQKAFSPIAPTIDMEADCLSPPFFRWTSGLKRTRSEPSLRVMTPPALSGTVSQETQYSSGEDLDQVENFLTLTLKQDHEPTPQPPYIKSEDGIVDTYNNAAMLNFLQFGNIGSLYQLMPMLPFPPTHDENERNYGSQNQIPSHTSDTKGNFKRGPVTRCQNPDCKKWCTYGYEGQKPMFCKAHILPGMVDMASRRCFFPDCRKSSSFAFSGQQPQFCKTHSAPGMINVVSRRCEREGCASQPGFGFEGQKPKFCGKHKEEGMLYIRNKCVEPGCGKSKKFSFSGEKPTHCRIHALPGMECAIKKRSCDFPGCLVLSSAPAGCEKSRYCAEHSNMNGSVWTTS